MLSEPSRFLLDLPPERIDGAIPGAQNWIETSYRRQTTWESPVEKTMEPRFRAGMRVRHPAFGDGYILNIEIDTDEQLVTVQFEEGQPRQFIASSSPFEILE